MARVDESCESCTECRKIFIRDYHWQEVCTKCKKKKTTAELFTFANTINRNMRVPDSVREHLAALPDDFEFAATITMTAGWLRAFEELMRGPILMVGEGELSE